MAERFDDLEQLFARAEALLALADYGIPDDVQELLVNGDPMRGVRPGALDAAIAAAVMTDANTQIEMKSSTGREGRE